MNGSRNRVRIGMRALAVLAWLAVASLLVAGQLALGLTIDWADPDPFALIAPLAVPIGVLLALRHARRVILAREFDMVPVVLFAAQAVLVGGLSVSAIAVVAALLRGVGYAPLDLLASFAALTLAGFVFAGIPVLLLAWVCAIGWALLLRALSTHVVRFNGSHLG